VKARRESMILNDDGMISYFSLHTGITSETVRRRVTKVSNLLSRTRIDIYSHTHFF
jgi:hypothetical protein